MKSKNAKRQWLFPLLLVLAAALTIAGILLAVGLTRQEAPVPSAAAAMQTEHATEAATEAVTEAVTETEPPTEPPLPQPEYDFHAAYMHGADSFFLPNRLLSRAEAAILVFRLFGGAEKVDGVFYDVTEDRPDYWEILRVSEYFPMHTYGYFLPDEPILREDLFDAVFHACHYWSLCPDELAHAGETPYAAFALQLGLMNEDETSEYVTRGEAAHIFNRVMGRSPDLSALTQQMPAIFADVSPACPYYADIMEAAVSHEFLEDGEAEQWHAAQFEALDSGIYRQGGVAYCLPEDGALLTTPGLQDTPFGTVLVADESGMIYADDRPHWTPDGVVFCRRNGTILQNGRRNGGVYDENGFYSSGDQELDDFVQTVYDECTTAEMTQEEKLRACFDYVRSFRYLGRNSPLDRSVKTMPYDLAQSYALKIFNTGKGDCYNFTAAFLFLARGLGYDAKGIVGYCGYFWSDNAIAHGWVEITMDDGNGYIYDPQIENYNIRAGISNDYYGAFKTTYAQSYAEYYPN